jgi:hypothetical protein
MSGPAIRVAGGSGAAVATPALDWVVQTLWGMPANGPARPPRRLRRSGETFAVLPSAAHPRLLVPLGSRRAASHALREYTPGRRGVRLAKGLLTMGIRSGLAQPLLRDRVHVTVDGDFHPAELREVLLKEHLQEVFGRRDLEMAVKFDAPRPHCKPTIQILSRDGRAVGFAKVGWNDLTRPLVVNEARALERLKHRHIRLREFDVPDLIHAGRWRDLEILIVAPVSFGARRRFIDRPPIPATDEVGQLASTRREPLRASRWWSAALERVAATAADGAPPRLAAAVDEIDEQFGDAVLEFGSWHGDWVPWNMGRRGTRLYVWDWERSGELAPRGLDGVHFAYQAELGLRGTPPVPALAATLRRVELLLPELNVGPEHGRLLLALHLLEMALRFDEARAAGVETSDPKYLGALSALLGDVWKEAP